MDMFLEKMAEILEVDTSMISLDFDFRTLPDWGSLMGFSVLIMLNNDYGVQVTPDEFMSLKTVGDIYTKTLKS